MTEMPSVVAMVDGMALRSAAHAVAVTTAGRESQSRVRH